MVKNVEILSGPDGWFFTWFSWDGEKGQRYDSRTTRPYYATEAEAETAAKEFESEAND